MQSGLLSESGKNKSLKESNIVKRIEKRAENIPSSYFVSAAAASVAIALGLAFTKKKQWANFVGQWVPTILLLGIYNKMLKSQGSEKQKELFH